MVKLSGVGWLEGEFAPLWFSSSFVVLLLLYHLFSALRVYSPLERKLQM